MVIRGKNDCMVQLLSNIHRRKAASYKLQSDPQYLREVQNIPNIQRPEEDERRESHQEFF